MDNDIDKQTMDGNPRLDSPERSSPEGRPLLGNFLGCSTLSRLVNRGLSEDPSATSRGRQGRDAKPPGTAPSMNRRGFTASSAMADGTSLIASLVKQEWA
jgi:hypothetical protein